MNRNVMQSIGDLIREAREARGLSLRQLAEQAGVSYSTIAKIETGTLARPKAPTLMKLARTLDVDLEDLYALAGYATPEALPDFAPYLRAKYGLSKKAIKELEGVFEQVQQRGQKGGRRGRTTD